MFCAYCDQSYPYEIAVSGGCYPTTPPSALLDFMRTSSGGYAGWCCQFTSGTTQQTAVDVFCCKNTTISPPPPTPTPIPIPQQYETETVNLEVGVVIALIVSVLTAVANIVYCCYNRRQMKQQEHIPLLK